MGKNLRIIRSQKILLRNLQKHMKNLQKNLSNHKKKHNSQVQKIKPNHKKKHNSQVQKIKPKLPLNLLLEYKKDMKEKLVLEEQNLSFHNLIQTYSYKKQEKWITSFKTILEFQKNLL